MSLLSALIHHRDISAPKTSLQDRAKVGRAPFPMAAYDLLSTSYRAVTWLISVWTVLCTYLVVHALCTTRTQHPTWDRFA